MKPSLRAAIGPALVLVAYFALRLVFAALTEDEGLFTPSGAPNLAVAVLGLGLLCLRLVVLFLLPAVVVFRLLAPAREGGRDAGRH